MKIIEEKTDWVLKVGKKYVYRIFKNGNGDITISVQTRKAFENVSLDEEAIYTMSISSFSVVNVEWINKKFGILRKELSCSLMF